MEILISDTNILIDLSNAGLLDSCKSLNISFQTIDFVINEITDENQYAAVQQLVDSGYLRVNVFSDKEMMVLYDYFSKIDDYTNLSIVDCALLLFAKNGGCRLLTGDKALKNKAIQEGVIVSGLLYLTDLMVVDGVVDKMQMADCLERLLQNNCRLPKSIIRERIDSYRNNE